jgi:hypothetical protein
LDPLICHGLRPTTQRFSSTDAISLDAKPSLAARLNTLIPVLPQQQLVPHRRDSSAITEFIHHCPNSSTKVLHCFLFCNFPSSYWLRSPRARTYITVVQLASSTFYSGPSETPVGFLHQLLIINSALRDIDPFRTRNMKPKAGHPGSCPLISRWRHYLVLLDQDAGAITRQSESTKSIIDYGVCCSPSGILLTGSLIESILPFRTLRHLNTTMVYIEHYHSEDISEIWERDI